MSDGFLQPQYSQRWVKQMAEMEREAKDTWLVVNPTDQDFIVWWNKAGATGGERWTIPAKNKNMGNGNGQRIVPMYIMLNYVDQMTKFIMIKASDEAVKAENQRRQDAGMAKMNKWEDQPVFESAPEYSLGNEAKKEEIAMTLVKGIVERYGMDQIEITSDESIDSRPMLERLVDRFRHQPLQSEPISETILPSPQVDEDGEPLIELKINELRSRVRAKGETVDLTEKKEDLIKRLEGNASNS